MYILVSRYATYVSIKVNLLRKYMLRIRDTFNRSYDDPKHFPRAYYINRKLFLTRDELADATLKFSI